MAATGRSVPRPDGGPSHGRTRSGLPAAEVWSAVSSADAALLQNTLMRVPDKVCAVALSTLPREKRMAVYARIAGPKAARIEQEIALEGRRRTSAPVRARIIRSFLSYFGRERKVPGRIWIRPTRGRRPAREDGRPYPPYFSS